MWTWNICQVWTKITNILGISQSTLYRHLDEGISQHTTFTDISDAELDQKVAAIKNVHPNDGKRMMVGHLAQCGIIDSSKETVLQFIVLIQ